MRKRLAQKLGAAPTLLAEPVRETRRADPRVIAGSEAVIVHFCAEVASVNVCDHLPCVSFGGQVSSDKLIHAYRFGPRQLDRAVQRLVDCDVGQCGGDVIGRLGLNEHGGQITVLPSMLESAMPPMNS